MAFKMKGFSGFKKVEDHVEESDQMASALSKKTPEEKKAKKLRKAQNKHARQASRQYSKTQKKVHPYVKGTKTNKEVLDRLADPKTETKYKKKQGIKAMAGLAAVGTGIAKLFANSPQLSRRWMNKN
jgi:tRNA G26 N,N-dimethylase Trm1